jgi:phosphonopyruvate decarboxylase
MDPQLFAQAVRRAGIGLVTGVPDSLLKDLTPCLHTVMGSARHQTATHEGSAIGLAIGHYLASGSPALVYLQNSGLGNAINPLASLAAPEIYGIPMVLLVGWRAEVLDSAGAQAKDEPQHILQGRITLQQLDNLGIPFEVLDADSDEQASVARAVASCLSLQRPVALVVRRGSFAAAAHPQGPIASSTPSSSGEEMSREAAIGAVLSVLDEGVPIVATTGMASRELFEWRQIQMPGHAGDLLVVGGMGHALSIATGLARSCGSPVVCLDGDGALLMHMGAMALAAATPGLLHIVLNNGAHDSVGGDPTVAKSIDLCAIARAMGYGSVRQASSTSDIGPLCGSETPVASQFLEIRCRPGHRTDLARPDRSPEHNRHRFMEFLKETRSACSA